MLKNKPEAGVIEMRGVVGFDFTADDFRAALDEHNGADVTIIVDSEGGKVTEGVSIYNAIATYTGNVTVKIDTICASIATIISCAATKVVMNSTARYMIHKCWVTAMGNSDELRNLAVMADMLDGDMADIYAQRTGKSKETLLGAMAAETWYSPEEALAEGFIDEIVQVDPKSAANAAVVKDRAPVALF